VPTNEKVMLLNDLYVLLNEKLMLLNEMI